MTASWKLSDLTDLEMASIVLQEAGSTREEAQAALLANPSLTETLGGKIAARRDEFAAEVARVEQQAYAKTPAGRLEAGKAALEADVERRSQVEAGRALLASEGQPSDGFTDDEILWSSGIVPKPVERMSIQERDEAAEHLAENWHLMDEFEARARAGELGASLDAIKSHREVRGLDAPAEGGEGE